MNEYLVNMRIRTPANMDPAEHARLYEAEAEHCAKVRDQGMVSRLWRVLGRTDNWGVWQAESQTELHKAIAGFPLFPYMDVTVIPLAENVNDPGLRLLAIALGEAYSRGVVAERTRRDEELADNGEGYRGVQVGDGNSQSNVFG